MAAAAPDVLLEELARAARPDGEVERRRMLLISNPYAATVSDRLRTLVAYALHGRYEVTAVDTRRRGHATELSREAADDGFDVVVAFGGDGTVNEAANGLAGSDTALTCLPGGSANVFGKMLGLPGDLVDATERLLRLADGWEPWRVDLGRVEHRAADGEWAQRLFTFSSGIGLDAAVVRRVDASPRLKARFGPWWFVVAGLGCYARRYLVDPPRVRMTAGDRELEGITAIVQNGDPYTFFNDRPVHVAEGESLDSGTLGAIMLDRVGPAGLAPLIARLMIEPLRVVRHRRVEAVEDVEQVEVHSLAGDPLPLQVDGDHVGDVVTARYGVIRRGLSVIG